MEEKGFIKTIFDFSFDQFITTRVIKFLLGLAMLGTAIATIGMIISAFRGGAAWGIIVLILCPVIYVLMILVARIYLELIIVAFRIVEHLGAIREMMAEKKPKTSAQD